MRHFERKFELNGGELTITVPSSPMGGLLLPRRTYYEWVTANNVKVNQAPTICGDTGVAKLILYFSEPADAIAFRLAHAETFA